MNADKRKDVLSTFRRAMMRYQKRALALGGFEGLVIAAKLRCIRIDPDTYGDEEDCDDGEKGTAAS